MPINFSLFKQKLKELELQTIEQLKEMFAEVFQVYQKDIQSFEANLWLSLSDVIEEEEHVMLNDTLPLPR